MAGGVLAKDFSQPDSPIIRFFSAADPGYPIIHNLPISDMATLVMTRAHTSFVIHNYGSSDKSKNNIISISYRSVDMVLRGKIF